MQRSAEILLELRELQSPLVNMSWQSPLAVPEAYFENLAAALTEDVRLSNSVEPTLNGVSKKLPFGVPDGYFSGLAEALQKDIVSQNIMERAVTPFQTPAGYFDTLPATLLHSAVHEETKKVRKVKLIDLNLQWRSVIRMAAAAVLVIGIGFGSFRYFHHETPENKVAKQLARMDARAIDMYIEQHIDDFDAESLEAVATNATDIPSINSLEAAEIQEYLQEDGELVPDQQKTL